MSISEDLEKLYAQAGKHAAYQSLPDCVRKILPRLKTGNKWENERFAYIAEHVNLKDRKVLDIGGNTGFFSFEAVEHGARQVILYEGSRQHAEFVKKISEILGLADKIVVKPDYYDFNETKDPVDVIFCLNVIHHLGDDFGIAENKHTAKQKMADCVNKLANIADTLILQMGYNWQGNINQPLFRYGKKIEIESFLRENLQDHWLIEHIGIAQKADSAITYNEKNTANMARFEALGEFLNRPIFILKSKHSPLKQLR